MFELQCVCALLWLLMHFILLIHMSSDKAKKETVNGVVGVILSPIVFVNKVIL